MQISTRAGSGAELRVEPGNEYFSKKAVRLRDSGDTGKSQLFDQPILQGTEEPLDPALGLRGKRMDDIDVELAHRALKLGQRLRVVRQRLGVDLVRRMAVQIDAEGFAVALDVLLPKAADGLHAFVAHEPRLGDPARGVVDCGKETAALRSVFEPGFVGAVELFQFPVGGLALAPGMVGALHPAGLGAPQASLDHDLPDAFGRQADLVTLGELLASERRFEIRVAGFQYLQD